ncbi:hypothetical protein FDECE_14413 [Fusarium decemcellulare]|nr:hypothetical protein FDECE_14413 [Fusarium decemcellulare]
MSLTLSTRRYTGLDRLTTLADELLLEVFSHLPANDGAGTFACTCKRLYRTFIDDFYRKLINEFGAYPMFRAAQRGSVPALERFLKAGVPLDYFGYGAFDPDSPSDEFFIGTSSGRPLIHAMRFYHVEAVEWLLVHGANPNRTEEDEEEGFQHPLEIAAAMANSPHISSGEAQEVLRIWESKPDLYLNRSERWKRACQMYHALVKHGARLPPKSDSAQPYDNLSHSLISSPF